MMTITWLIQNSFMLKRHLDVIEKPRLIDFDHACGLRQNARSYFRSDRVVFTLQADDLYTYEASLMMLEIHSSAFRSS
jgi:hypothetical protein